MKIIHFILALIVTTLAGTTALAQINISADSIHNEGVKLYSQKQIREAAKKFEEVLAKNPKHKNAIFNLGVIYYNNGNQKLGLNYLQTCVKLGDRDAADYIKYELKQPIALADTMHILDVDIAPKVKNNSKTEELLMGEFMHPTLAKEIGIAFSKSKIIRKDTGKSKTYYLSLLVTNEGKLDAKLLNPDTPPAIQQEVTKILHTIIPVITPAKHQGKVVTASGLTVPIRLAL